MDSIQNGRIQKSWGQTLPTPWLLEPAKRPDDRAEYCLHHSWAIKAKTIQRFALGPRFYGKISSFRIDQYNEMIFENCLDTRYSRNSGYLYV